MEKKSTRNANNGRACSAARRIWKPSQKSREAQCSVRPVAGNQTIFQVAVEPQARHYTVTDVSSGVGNCPGGRHPQSKDWTSSISAPLRKRIAPRRRRDDPGLNLIAPSWNLDDPGRNLSAPGRKRYDPSQNLVAPGRKRDDRPPKLLTTSYSGSRRGSEWSGAGSRSFRPRSLRRAS